ncbi:alanine racemase [Xanthobacter pseudotagetidis]|uniref:alanine racemase n=1 Tax=Xanthobacter pseudotagetidis TaxID=3119911 RepID=UPI0037283739
MPPARPGDPVAAIDTPALLVDLDALEANIAAMAAFARQAGLALRPHAKTHKCVEIARRQLAAGAVGLCCQKVSEAEALLPSGVGDLLVSNHIVGVEKLARLAALARRARVTTLTADAAHVALLSAAAIAHGVTFEVLVEIDAGDDRMGLCAQDLLPVARAVAATPGLVLRGLQAYSGPLQHVRDAGARAAAAAETARRAARARAILEAEGLPCPLITGGGTGSFLDDGTAGVLNEIQPGSYVFMDADYARNRDRGGGPYRPFAQSLFVRTAVLRARSDGVSYVDAGAKALNLDCGMPEVAGRGDLSFTKASDEQGRIEAADPALAPALGEALDLVPSHCDPTVALYDTVVAIRRGRVEALWPVEGRGART